MALTHIKVQGIARRIHGSMEVLPGYSGDTSERLARSGLTERDAT